MTDCHLFTFIVNLQIYMVFLASDKNEKRNKKIYNEEIYFRMCMLFYGMQLSLDDNCSLIAGPCDMCQVFFSNTKYEIKR